MPEQNKIHIKASDDALRPTYSNSISIAHTGEEFVLDVMSMHPPHGVLINRIAVSPQHAKRLRDALVDNIKKYESKFGPIESKGVAFDVAALSIGENSAE